MRTVVVLILVLVPISLCAAPKPQERHQAEYYVRVYARHYRIPVQLVRSIIQQESAWNPCAVSLKGAVGLMQLMPETARRFGVRNRCNIRENIAGGVGYLAWLLRKFQGDARLAVAAYYAGEGAIERRGLSFRNADVVAYVYQVRSIYGQLTSNGGVK